MQDIIYFSFNNWFGGRDYPIGEKYSKLVNEHYFNHEDWVKENKLVVVTGNIDMSVNWCVAAPKEWVEENLPELLTNKEYSYDIISHYKGEDTITTYTKKYSDFVYPGTPWKCKYGMPFKEYDEEAVGVYYIEENEWEENE